MAGLICLRTPIDAAHHVMNFTYNMIRETRHDDIILVSHKIEYKIIQDLGFLTTERQNIYIAYVCIHIHTDVYIVLYSECM